MGIADLINVWIEVGSRVVGDVYDVMGSVYEVALLLLISGMGSGETIELYGWDVGRETMECCRVWLLVALHAFDAE